MFSGQICKCQLGVLRMNLIGGLGNQLFQLASVAELSWKYGIPFVLDAKSLDREFGLSFLNVFPNNAYKVMSVGTELRFIESQACGTPKLRSYSEKNFHYTPIKLKGNHIKLQGYFQTEKYFLSISSGLRDLLRQNLQIESGTINSHAAIQIRMGDMARNVRSRNFHGIITDNYIKEACEILDVNPRDLMVFSDDFASIEHELPIFYSTNSDRSSSSNALSDLQRLSAQNRLIISNSSFGWWAAWLSSAKVVAPKNWFAKKSRKLNTKDLIPIHWFTI